VIRRVRGRNQQIDGRVVKTAKQPLTGRHGQRWYAADNTSVVSKPTAQIATTEVSTVVEVELTRTSVISPTNPKLTPGERMIPSAITSVRS
jgi:hypothetical protein